VGEAMRRLYRDRDAAGALEVLEAHARRGRGALGPEAWATKVDALVALGRKGEALALLDRAPLAALPRPRERRALRGELRAGAGRCADALADFEVVAGAGPADAALERALFGRAACRGQAGDRAGARADLERLLALFPAGRFAGAAARALGGPGR
jgi:tetratricopeptide (TPR) repeat protein